MRVLFLSPVPPWPARSGGRIRTQSLLRALRTRVDLRLLAVEDPATTSAPDEELPDYTLYPRSRPPALARLLRPRPARWFHSRALTAAVRDELEHGTFDLVHLDEPLQLDAVPRPCPVPLVVHHHKLDRELAAATRVAPHERLRWRRLEARAAAASPHHVVCAEEDARRLRARHPALQPVVVSNGVDRPPDSARPLERDARTVLFLGSLDYAPNLDALALLTGELWPRLRAVRPDLRLRVLGARATDAARRLATAPGIEFIGEVLDARVELARASLLLAPLRIGGGSRLKIPQALAHGCPVVATSIAAEGLGLDRRHISLADDVPGLAAACLDVLADPTRARAQATAGRAEVLARLTWPQLADELLAVWQRAASGA